MSTNPRIRFGNDDKNIIFRDTSNNDNMVVQINNDEVITLSNLQNEHNIFLGTTEPILVINDLQTSSLSNQPYSYNGLNLK